MEKRARNSMLCPNCRSLISLDEERCPHCGLRNPGSRWKSLFTGRGSLLSPERLIVNIIWVNAGMYVLSILIHPASIGLSANPLSFLSPSDNSLLVLGATGTIPIIRLHRWWTLLSAGWLHGSILHILFNMIALRQIGPFIIQEYGPFRMVSIYTLSGAGGFFVSYLAGVPFTIGASAAVCGLIGAALYYGRSRGGAYGQAVYHQVGGWAVSIFVFGFLIPGINNWAHGGGLLCGVLAGFLLGYKERFQENYFHRLLAAICALSTLGALLAGVGSLL
ncbi:MAG TPA: rhomboid family intramembrane serine protease [Syntrophobacteraceae bacterium]|nr:rhomboid family intramembrane serine protease [Syntrophobacteraceae bacterium]